MTRVKDGSVGLRTAVCRHARALAYMRRPRFSGAVLRGLAVLALVAACEWPSAFGQPPEIEVASLVRRLGSQSSDEREAANAELARLGNRAAPALQSALEDTDPEIRLRASGLLAQLHSRQMWEPSRVTWHGNADSATRVLEDISEQTGNSILVGDQYGTFKDGPLTATWEDQPFWQALDELCRQTGNHVRPHHDTRAPALVVVQGNEGKQPVAYSGPIRGQITQARRVFIEELDYQDDASELTHTFQLNVQMLWEDRFRLTAYRSQPEVLEATTDTGAKLAAVQGGSSTWSVVTTGGRQVTMSLRLQPPPRDAKSLKSLKLRWGLIGAGDYTVMEITSLHANQVHLQDDAELVIESMTEVSSKRHEIVLRMTRDLALPEPHEIIFQENRVELLDANGVPFQLQGQINSVQEGRVKLTFIGNNTHAKPAVLKVHYPRIRAQRDLEIEFVDVPLPCTVPQ